MKDLVFKIKDVQFIMKPVSGGAFLMGATPEQDGPYEFYKDKEDERVKRIPMHHYMSPDIINKTEEKPVHKVTLSDFYIGETVVTQSLWKAIMGTNPSFVKRDDLPVEKVSYNQIVNEFIPKLNDIIGKSFRLPTEAEWEYAARGGESFGTKYSGSNDIDTVAWYAGNSNSKYHPVKTKKPNSIGLYDMSGNIYEWCSDWYGEYQEGHQINPTGPSDGTRRVLRGGNQFCFAEGCRVSARWSFNPDSIYNNDGFRLALDC